MIAKAACRGAATIVNAIATGRGAAFGITLEADVRLDVGRGDGGVTVEGTSEGQGLVASCIQAVADRAAFGPVEGTAYVRSDIPISRGLKSSSAVTNAAVLGASMALDADLQDEDILCIAIDESIRAGVTVTGAFDDAAACFHGGVAVTDNDERRIMRSLVIEDPLEVVVHVPNRRISKSDVTREMFAGHSSEFDEAIRLALKGDYAEAMRLNSKLCSEILDVSNEVAESAMKAGAKAAGITGTGPATVILCRTDNAANIVGLIDDGGAEILRARLNNTCSREVVPRLL